MKRVPHINSGDPEATVGAALQPSQGFRAGQCHRRRSLEVAVGLSSIYDQTLATVLLMDKKARAMKPRRPRKADESLLKKV